LPNEAFHESIIGWAQPRGFEYDDADSDDRGMVHKNFTAQVAQLVVNRIVLYKILVGFKTDKGDIRPLVVSIYRVHDDLEEYFEGMIDNVCDSEAILGFTTRIWTYSNR
jgi:hypothetical protein